MVTLFYLRLLRKIAEIDSCLGASAFYVVCFLLGLIDSFLDATTPRVELNVDLMLAGTLKGI